jgi:aminoglycoside phosphotransferase (APT) family kinase protein
MTFKTHWEKTDQHFQVSAQTIQAMVSLALPEKKLVSHEVISGGCVNLNVKLNLTDENQPFILRTYVRDKAAAYREQKLAGLIKSSVPLPEVYFIGDFEDFDNGLKIAEPLSRQSYITYARECLTHPTVVEVLGAESIRKINEMLGKYGTFFPDETETHLVHGDYGPENILVDKVESQWKITAILDWEFAYSGSTLCDVANMLRYAHHMPPIFEKS